MNKKEILSAIQKLKEESKERKFTQSYDLIVNLKHIDLKKTENQVDFFVPLPKGKGKENKICAFSGPESKDDAKAACDFVVDINEFDTYKDIKKVKKLAETYDIFMAQANVMPKVAATFGRVLGPRQKMPNPKSGSIFAPKTNLTPIVEKMKNTIRISAKTSPIIQVCVGNQKLSDEDVTENIILTYDQIIHHLPNELNNIKNVYLKLTMSKPIELER